MTSDNFIALSGTVPERPTFSKTNDGVPIADFYLEVRNEWIGKAGQPCDKSIHILCRTSGHGANSLRRYFHPGCYVRIVGHLDQLEQEACVHIAGLGYLSPRTVMEARPA